MLVLHSLYKRSRVKVLDDFAVFPLFKRGVKKSECPLSLLHQPQALAQDFAGGGVAAVVKQLCNEFVVAFAEYNGCVFRSHAP